VRVPKSGRVGAENDGWSVAKHLLKHERGGSAASPAMLHAIDRIRQTARQTPSPFGGVLADDPVFQRDLGELEADVMSCRHFEQLAISGHPLARDAAYPSVNKTMNSELSQRISIMMTRVSGIETVPQQLEALVVGSNVAPLGDDFDLIAMPYYLNTRATSIYAGSNEVQRDLIARTVLAANR